ncbi:hypothetical protein [Methylorubrum extorquens]|uniref:hypothetical protein n=1 Tax=Methylorubrum extorquens TaxID=408 RepID=UPI001301716D|nr:hypothetical protein [Methylorubrum extorquens]
MRGEYAKGQIWLDNGKFKVIRSNKAGLTSEESLVVVRDRTSYLRILGKEPEWVLMTATASEDDGYVKVCSDKRRLIETAIWLCHELGFIPRETKDQIGREYVKICTIVREHNEEDLGGVLVRNIEKFFDFFDGSGQPVTGRTDNMLDLYEAISLGGDGEDVYLSDGVWLSSDGSIHERGR